MIIQLTFWQTHLEQLETGFLRDRNQLQRTH